jgi:hypothetical protein
MVVIVRLERESTKDTWATGVRQHAGIGVFHGMDKDSILACQEISASKCFDRTTEVVRLSSGFVALVGPPL